MDLDYYYTLADGKNLCFFEGLGRPAMIRFFFTKTYFSQLITENVIFLLEIVICLLNPSGNVGGYLN